MVAGGGMSTGTSSAAAGGIGPVPQVSQCGPHMSRDAQFEPQRRTQSHEFTDPDLIHGAVLYGRNGCRLIPSGRATASCERPMAVRASRIRMPISERSIALYTMQSATLNPNCITYDASTTPSQAILYLPDLVERTRSGSLRKAKPTAT
jgi:hypothetical protein